ncbi:protein transport protein Sec16A isoform X1 [Mustela putorius furo]|uniref:Protein transport protein sec16 n=2 Tax=Mustela putorius furo TaxID=9669 RepID=A0A8U0NWT7_MUSPF|nr:protein transport protein Sec16A isoform X1 [Mustela putorius furo]XP_012913979.2 protein transport protein Sec16A isoform X1 [Mustela putorius furo]XP_012913980.2 protein transport protein Sec16A isoform X1 [Mustela putorius furo]
MQPPPQAAPSGMVGPPPAGTPQSMFWSNRPYRRQANNNAPVTPITCPLQPVTDPFAFSRQALQSTSLGSSSKSSPPLPQGPAPPAFLQHPGLSVAHTNAEDTPQGPMSQPRADGSLFSGVLTPSVPSDPEGNRSTTVAPSSEPETQTLPHPQCVPGAGVDSSHGGRPHTNTLGPDRPLSRQNPHDSATASAPSPFFPQPRQQMPGQWGPGQGGAQPSGQHYWPRPEGPIQNALPHTSSVSHFPAPSTLHHGPSHEQLNPLVSLPGPLASDGSNEAACLQSGNRSANNFDPENVFRQNSKAGSTRASQELRPNPGVNKEQLPDFALSNPLTQGTSPESHLHCPPGAGTSRAVSEVDSGALPMVFQGGETENEENLSSENTGSAGRSDFGGFSPSPALGHPPAHVGAGGIYQAFPRGSNSEATQQGRHPHPYFYQTAGAPPDHPPAASAPGTAWGGAPGAGVHATSSAQSENVEDLEFIQNQEVLPSEPQSLDLSSPSDQVRYGPLSGPAVPRLGVVGHSGGGGPNLEAPDSAPHPVQSDGVSSGYSSKSHRNLPSVARPQDVGTFIQQEVGKPEDESPGSFFKQIDSSPVGGETDETTGNQSHHGSLSQPSTPSPPKPTGIFQTSANSSFEPVKSHLVGVKPIEADRANMVGEVRGAIAHQKQRRPAAAPPDTSPGNLEQPPDNMETLFTLQACSPPFSVPAEPGHGLVHTGGPPLEILPLAAEKRPLARAQGVVKCESPVTTLWAQNELPDFGGNVLLAPAAPALHMPVKPPPSEVIQPPDEGASAPQARQPGSGLLQSGDRTGASENLENPPKMGEEEALPSQASSGYASLLSSPPTESLQNPPVLIAQPDRSYHLAQPINFSVSLPSPNEKNHPWRDALVGDKPLASSWALGGDSGDSAPVSGNTAGPLTRLPLPNSFVHSGFPQVPGTSEIASNQPATLLVQPPPHPVPKNLVSESQNTDNAENGFPELVSGPAGSTGVTLVPPANAATAPAGHKADRASQREETSGALDLTPSRTLESSLRMCSPPHSDSSVCQHAASSHPRPPGPGPRNSDHFYQQVMKDTQDQRGLERAQQEPAPPPPQGPKLTCSEPSDPGSPPVQGQPQNSVPPPPSPAPADTGQPLPPRPPRSSSASVASASSSQAAVRSDQPWLQPPPPDLASYYYYRALYDGCQSHYPSSYPLEPGAAPLYYQDIYGLYEPRYRSYDSTASAYAENYRYSEPERPSSRASHCSDRPPARHGYPEGYYDSKSGWSSQSDHYADYYSGQYEYGDLGRWDRYHYGSRFRDPRTCDRRYWYDAEYDAYRKENYAYGDSRCERYDDPWRYDPRFTGSFDDDPEPHRDPYGEEADRRSVHSERSAQSLRSSFSSHSRQSQIYRNHSVAAAPYEVPPPPGSLPGDYAYGAYGSNFGSAQGFPEYGYAAEAGWPTTEQAPSRPTSPEKFSVPHVCARFGPGGQLIKVIPNLPSEGQPALVEIHSMETLLQHTPEQEELRSFPGPLGKDDTHKADVINFAQSKATNCLQNQNLIDKESASLLWNFIVLLCRQNGTVVGTDLAELLLRDHRTVWLPGKSPNEANLIDFTNEAVEQVEEEESGEAQLSFLTDNQAAGSNTLEKETERFRELLLYGRKKDALESAMKNALWGHALLLASKMDSRTHARVMTRFANSLPINDPLQTVYQLMSGRMPAASTCCGDEKWGDWRPHLAMVLSNLSSNVDVESRAMATMGDTLASKGLLDAAHFCYLMAQVGLGVYTKKTTKLVLIGSNHSLPFLKFATNEAIQRTEAYEYAQSLGAQTCSFPNFQVFKFIYSCRLAEMGLATQAFHYCEVIAKSVLLQPHKHSPVLISQLAQVASQLRLFDPQLREKPEQEAFVEPAWLVQLQRVDRQLKEGAAVWSRDGTFPQRCPSTPSSEAGPCDGLALGPPGGLGAGNPLLAPPVPSAEHLGQGVRLLPSAPPTLPDSQPALPARVPLFPVPPATGPLELGPSCGPPAAVFGFPEPSGSDPVALYTGPGLPPCAPSLPESEHAPQEARSQDPGAMLPEALGRSSLLELREEGFGGKFANLGSSGVSQDSDAPPAGEGASSSALQPPTSAPEVKRPAPANRKDTREPKKSGESWFSRWLPGKRRTEAYLPDDKNKSIVWDEKKNRWVDVSEPEEERKAPPPPPISLPKAPLAAPPGPGGPPRASVNMFSRKAAGARARYVDVLNPGGPQRSEPALAPAELFAPLAPIPIPAHVFGPNPDAEEVPPAGCVGREGQVPAGGPASAEPASEPQAFSSATSLAGPELPPAGEDGSRGGELSRCSSLSSLSREVSQHFYQAPSDHPGAAVPFYSPAPFAQASAPSGGSRMGRIGQRKYPALS